MELLASISVLTESFYSHHHWTMAHSLWSCLLVSLYQPEAFIVITIGLFPCHFIGWASGHWTGDVPSILVCAFALLGSNPQLIACTASLHTNSNLRLHVVFTCAVGPTALLARSQLPWFLVSFNRQEPYCQSFINGKAYCGVTGGHLLQWSSFQ